MCGNFPSSIDESIPIASLSLGWSPSSNLLQLRNKSDITDMYGDNYGYRSGLNTSMVKHPKEKVKFLRASIILMTKCLDIGSNDGTTLSFYPKDIKRIGIDPTIKNLGNIIKKYR